jgi:hypothetical protein
MTNTKLPPYFEKYFEQKFGEVNGNILELTKSLGTCESRVTTLEVWKANIMGKIAILSIAFVVIMNLIVDWVKTRFDLK